MEDEISGEGRRAGKGVGNSFEDVIKREVIFSEM
jgi:hypothetical protein